MHNEKDVLIKKVPIHNPNALTYLEKSKLLIKSKGQHAHIYSYISRSSGVIFTTGITLEGARQVGILQSIADAVGISLPEPIGLLSMVGGGALIVLIAILRTGQIALSFLDRQFEKLRDRHLKGLRAIEASIEDLAKIRQAGAAVTGDHTFVPLKTMEWLFNKNRKYIRAWVENAGTEANIGCFYIVAPITSKACKKMTAGKITKNRELTPSDVCKTFKNALGLYVIEVFGANRMSKASILYLLRTDMVKEILKSRGMRYVFTRPVNDFGLRQVEKLGFRPIGPHPHDMRCLDLYSEDRE